MGGLTITRFYSSEMKKQPYDEDNPFRKIVDSGRYLVSYGNWCMIRDLYPRFDEHLLLIHRGRLVEITEISERDAVQLLRMVKGLWSVFRRKYSGYRVQINNFASGGQEIPHLHVHLGFNE